MILWAACASAGRAQSPPPAAPPPPIATRNAEHPLPPLYTTRQHVFAIPFTPDRRVAQPVEVHLYASTDQGATWQLSARQQPETRQFTFRSRGDGEYWFASRTLDARQYTGAQEPLRPELRVVVDTTPPQIELTVHSRENGEVLANWQAADQNLQANSWKIEYQDDPSQPWKPVPIEPPPTDDLRTSCQGRTTWRPKTSSSVINVRAEVRDRAGNLAVVNRRLLLPPAASWEPGPHSAATAPIADPFARMGQASEGAVTWPSDNAWSPAMTAYAGTPATDATPPVTTPPMTAPPVMTQPETPSAAYSQFASARSDLAPRDPAPPASAVPANTLSGDPLASILPPGERPRMTRATRFQLHYDVDAVGPAGVEEVQLWATADGGQTWRMWGTDDDLQSPFDVEVAQEGIFGFHIVVIGRNGLAGRKPRTGDPADIYVGVDTLSPVARLTAAAYGEGSQAGKLVIRWEASDAYLDPRPITLKYSEDPAGPWTVIASALPNTGEFAWPVDARIPAAVYLQLEVRDEAGNVATDQTTDPVRIEGLAPKARIRGVQPIQDADREALRTPAAAAPRDGWGRTQ